jgi:hypothetical protein
MHIDKFTQEHIETLIKHRVDVSVALAISSVREIQSDKYAEATGIPHKRIKNWCIKGVLTCRRLDNDGNVITDFLENKNLGRWYIDTSKQIGEY